MSARQSAPCGGMLNVIMTLLSFVLVILGALPQSGTLPPSPPVAAEPGVGSIEGTWLSEDGDAAI